MTTHAEALTTPSLILHNAIVPLAFPRALILAVALMASRNAIAAEYTPDDVAQAVKRELPEETIMLMIEGQEWDLDDEATRRLLRAGVPAKYVALMLGDDGLSVEQLEGMAEAATHEIEGVSGSFCVVTTQDGEKYRGQILAATATSVVLVQVDDSVRVLPRETVVATTSARATLKEWRSRVGKQTFVSVASGEIVDGELVAAEEDVLVLRRASGKFQTILAEEVAGLVLSPPADRGKEENPKAGAPTAEDYADLPQTDAGDGDDDPAHWVERGAPEPNMTARRGQRTAAVGLTLGGVSGTLYGIGLATDSAEMYVIGSLGLVVAPPIIAGGSLRAQHGLALAGADVSPAWGYLSWVCWGGGLTISVVGLTTPTSEETLETAATFAAVSNGLLIASFVSGAAQVLANDEGVRDRGGVAASDEAERPSFALSFNGRGLTIAGQF